MAADTNLAGGQLEVVGNLVDRVLEEIFENSFVLFVDDRRDGKVSLESVNLLPELCVHVAHVGPLLGLVEEVGQTKLAAAQESGQGDAVAFH